VYLRAHVFKKIVATATAAGLGLAGAVVLAGAPAEAAMKKVETPFAYQGSAFGSRVTLGDPHEGGVASGRTAWSVLACTKMAPIRHHGQSDVSRLRANSMIEVGAVTSLTSTYRRPARKEYGSRSVNKVASLTVGAEDGPRLEFGALTTRGVAFNKRGRFGARAGFDIADVHAYDIDPSGSDTPGPLEDLLSAIDTADDQLVTTVIEASGSSGIDVPGVGTIYPAGSQRKRSNRRMAAANAFGIRVLLENGSRVTIGRAWAKIQAAAPAAVFAGHAYGFAADAADGVATLGTTPYQPLPCTGTNGNWRTNTLLTVGTPALQAESMKAQTFGRPFDDGRAVARSRARVADIVLGGRLELQGIVGQVNVFQNRAGRVVRRNVHGTRVGAILVDGEPQEVPPPGETLEIPGLAKLEHGTRENVGRRGLRVTALRVTMLDGSGLVLDIGTAKARIVR
jgi:hypothetical protein